MPECTRDERRLLDGLARLVSTGHAFAFQYRRSDKYRCVTDYQGGLGESESAADAVEMALEELPLERTRA